MGVDHGVDESQAACHPATGQRGYAPNQVGAEKDGAEAHVRQAPAHLQVQKTEDEGGGVRYLGLRVCRLCRGALRIRRPPSSGNKCMTPGVTSAS